MLKAKSGLGFMVLIVLLIIIRCLHRGLGRGHLLSNEEVYSSTMVGEHHYEFDPPDRIFSPRIMGSQRVTTLKECPL